MSHCFVFQEVNEFELFMIRAKEKSDAHELFMLKANKKALENAEWFNASKIRTAKLVAETKADHAEFSAQNAQLQRITQAFLDDTPMHRLCPGNTPMYEQNLDDDVNCSMCCIPMSCGAVATTCGKVCGCEWSMCAKCANDYDEEDSEEEDSNDEKEDADVIAKDVQEVIEQVVQRQLSNGPDMNQQYVEEVEDMESEQEVFDRRSRHCKKRAKAQIIVTAAYDKQVSAAVTGDVRRRRHPRAHAVKQLVFPQHFQSDCCQEIKLSTSTTKSKTDGTLRPKLKCTKCNKTTLRWSVLPEYRAPLPVVTLFAPIPKLNLTEEDEVRLRQSLKAFIEQE